MSLILVGTNRNDIDDWLRKNPTDRETFLAHRPDIVENFSPEVVGHDFLERAEIILVCDPLHYLQDYGKSSYFMLCQFLWYCQSIGAKIDSCSDRDIQHWVNLINEEEQYFEEYFRQPSNSQDFLWNESDISI